MHKNQFVNLFLGYSKLDLNLMSLMWHIYIINSLVCLSLTLSRLHFSTDSELKHMYGLLVAQGVPENYFPGDIPRNKKILA